MIVTGVLLRMAAVAVPQPRLIVATRDAITTATRPVLSNTPRP
jgi:hypothetical protein